MDGRVRLNRHQYSFSVWRLVSSIDVTIRFLVNYKQELAPLTILLLKRRFQETIAGHTGLSIVYTFPCINCRICNFCFSGFGGHTVAGWLFYSLPLLTATLSFHLSFYPGLAIGNGEEKRKAPGH